MMDDKTRQLIDAHSGLLQQNLALEEENEKLQKIREIALQMHNDWNNFDPINESYIEKLAKENQQLKEKLKVVVDKLLVFSKIGCFRVNNMFQCETCGSGIKEVCVKYQSQQALTKIGEIE